MPGIAHYGPVFHHGKMLPADHVDIAGDRAEKIADSSGIGNRHNGESIHDGLQGRHGIDLGNHHMPTHAPGTHGKALAAPSITAHHKNAAGNQSIGGANDPIDGALPGSVAIIEKMLGARIVDRDHRIPEHAFGRHAFQADDAGGCLLGSAADHIQQFRTIGMKGGNQVRPVVHGILRFKVQGRMDMAIIGLVVFSLDGKNRYAVIFNQRCGHIVLGTQRIGCANHHRRAAGLKHLHEGCGFRRHMKAGGKTNTA